MDFTLADLNSTVVTCKSDIPSCHIISIEKLCISFGTICDKLFQ